MGLKLVANPPPWPGGARCAVCFCFDFDAESLLHLYYPEDAARRINLSSSLRYGPRVAIPRIVEIWRHFGIKQTVYVPGWCVETYPEAAELLVSEGHELGHHGYLHERPNQLTRDDEIRPTIEKARSIKGPVLIEFIVEPEANVYPMVPPGGANSEMMHDPQWSPAPEDV